jgi:glutamate 5-kinase
MIIANGKDVGIIHQIMENDFIGTYFAADLQEDFFLADFIEENMQS